MKRSLLLVVLALLALAAALPAAPAHPAAKAAAPAAASAACAAAPAPVAVALGLGQKAINCTLFCESKNCPAGTTCGLDGRTNKCGCI